MPTIIIDPLTRIEGHSKWVITIPTAGSVTAKAEGTMFRGFENILMRRDPRDAPILTQRICGVCPTAHAEASARCLDNALEVGSTVWPASGLPQAKITNDDGRTHIPKNGRILRNLIHGADTVMSHITHFYHLAALDFVDASSLGAPFSPTYSTSAGLTALLPGSTPMPNGQSVVSNYVEALTMRRKMHSAGAVFSGRQPIQHAIIPGGVTTLPTASDVVVFANLLDTVRNFINTAYIPDVVTVANAYPTYWTVGTSPGNLLSYGGFPIQSGTAAETLLLSRGLYTGGSPVLTTLGPTSFLSNVKEFVGYSYYDAGALGQNDGLHPFAGVTLPDVSKVTSGGQAYSWLKAPRYTYGGNDLVCEVGPMPRVVLSIATGNPASVSEAKCTSSSVPVAGLGLGGSYTIANLGTTALGLVSQASTALISILGRYACRALECKFIADAMAETAAPVAWLTELQANGLTSPVYVHAKLPNKPKQGAGWAEVGRGSLGHWITIENKRIKNYQCVVPTTWNHSPRDTAGNPGPAEQVIQEVGPVLAGYTNTDDIIITALRALHAYDFCIACAVHFVRPDGSTIAKFKTDSDGRVVRIPHDEEI